jgi:hypothetical protein
MVQSGRNRTTKAAVCPVSSAPSLPCVAHNPRSCEQRQECSLSVALTPLKLVIYYRQMEEQEVDLDRVGETIHEKAHEITWAEKVALTTALFAVFAAISSLISTHQSDEAILQAVRAADQWALYQAKGIKGMITDSPAEKEHYDAEQAQISEVATDLDKESRHDTRVHEFFAFAVTAFQVATAIGAIAVLVKKKPVWYTSIALGLFGLAFIIGAFAVWWRI